MILFKDTRCTITKPSKKIIYDKRGILKVTTDIYTQRAFSTLYLVNIDGTIVTSNLKISFLWNSSNIMETLQWLRIVALM